LVDHRHPPPSPLTPEIRGFIVGVGESDRSMPTRAIQAQAAQRFGRQFSLRSVEDVLKSAGLARSLELFKPKGPIAEASATTAEATSAARTEREDLGGAGLAWLRVASELTGYGRAMAQVVSEVARSVPPPAEPIPVDRSHRDERGQFLREYNAPRARLDPQVGAVFESVDDKRVKKDLTRLSIRGTKPETIENKLLALMALPVVSDRGRFDGVTEPRGEWLASLGTHDYMPETLAKFARELKWAEASHPLMQRHAALWYEQLQPSLGEDPSAVVLYVDATTKPLWTNFFHKSGRVATLGRVMPCLETALIHTGSGVPLYLNTFAGHVPLVKNVLPLIHEMENAIGEGMLGRLTVIDGEMNAVALFKQFDADVNPRTGEKGRYFITPLSHAQVKSLDAVQGLSSLVPYREGDWIGGGWLDLVDSKDRKAKPYRARVIVLERRTKQTFTVYASNAPREEYADDVLMNAYFRRWPAQEHVIRELNGAVAFKTVHGYGKRRVVNITVVDELTKLEAQIERIDQRLQKARTEEREAFAQRHEAEENNQARQWWKEGAQRWQEHVGERNKAHTDTFQRAATDAREASVGARESAVALDKVTADHCDALAKVAALEERLIKKRTDVRVLESQREIYQNDVELDQILAVLKLGCALLVQFLLHRFFGGLAIEFNTFIREIFELPGVRIRTATTETIQFRGNRRNPKMMALLDEACHRFNALDHRRGDRVVRFEISWPPGSAHAT